MARISTVRAAKAVAASAAALWLPLGLAGCAQAEEQLDKAKSRVGEFTLRNAAAIAGTAAFKENGYELGEKLDCTADVAGDLTSMVACTGTTKDGKPVTLDGTADGDDLRKGSFVGKVDRQEVFSQNCLDCP